MTPGKQKAGKGGKGVLSKQKKTQGGGGRIPQNEPEATVGKLKSKKKGMSPAG